MQQAAGHGCEQCRQRRPVRRRPCGPERRWPRRLPPMEGRSCQDWRPQSQAARARLEEVGRELEQLQERRTEPRRAAAAENRKALEEAREEAAAAENVIQGHGLQMGGRQQPGAGKRHSSADAAEPSERRPWRIRIRLLTEMEKEYEGFSRAVKLVMQAADKGGLRGVHGPVASLMTTQEPIHRGHRDRPGRRPAEYRGGHGRRTPRPPSAT